MKKKIAIIGANSYIARNLIYVLQKDKNYVLRLYDKAEKQEDGIQPYKKIDMLSKDSVHELDLDCDIIYLFTGKTGSAEGFENYELFISVNEMTLLNLLAEYIHQDSHARIIFPSTRLVYKGKEGKLAEGAEKEFKTVYAMNKWACENYLSMYSRVYGIRYSIFRICIPYGTLIPGASSYGTAEFMLRKAKASKDIMLYGKGKVRRTLTYIGDLCTSLIQGALADQCQNDVFNVGGEDYSLKEMAVLIADCYGVGIVYREWPLLSLAIESGDTVFDAAKLERIIGKCQTVTFEEWCKKHGFEGER